MKNVENSSNFKYLSSESINYLIQNGLKTDDISNIDIGSVPIFEILIKKIIELTQGNELSKVNYEHEEKELDENKFETTIQSDNNLIDANKIYSSANKPYSAIGVSVSKLSLKGTECISYITICSSVASSGIASEIRTDTSNTKAALYGSAEDVQNISKYLMRFGKKYVCMGTYSFSKDSISSVAKDVFMNSLKNFFNNENTNGCMIYYSGHGMPDTSILLDTSQGSYFVYYDEIVSLWKNRANPKKNSHLLLILDCCYSGGWVKKLLERGDFDDISIQASSTEEQKSMDLGAGIGSLYTNALISVNLKFFKIKNFKLKFNLEQSLQKEKKLKEQQPRGVGFEDVLENKFYIKCIGNNSWQEMNDEGRPNWTAYQWRSTDNTISRVFIKKITTDLTNNYCEPHLIGRIDNGIFTIQGEIQIQAEVNSKYIIAAKIYHPEIQSSKKGHFSLYKSNNNFSAVYFNTFKTYLAFEKTPEEVFNIVNITNELIVSLEDHNCEKFNQQILNFINVI